MGRKPLQEKPSLKLVLKVGATATNPDGSESQTDDEKRMKKKRKLNEDSEEDEGLQKREEDEENEDDLSVRMRAFKKEKTPLQLCLDYIHKILQRKDVNGFFSFPVTDTIAPGYSKVISKGMDLSTMRKRIDGDYYGTVKEYREDFELMLHNCMDYNRADTVYHREAKRLLCIGIKHLTKDRLSQMKRNFSWMDSLTPNQIGLIAEEAPIVVATPTEAVVAAKSSSDLPEGVTSKFEAIPDNMESEQVLQEVKMAAQMAAQKLQAKSPNNKMGYLSKAPDGTTTLNFINPSNERAKVVDLGSVVGRLVQGSDELMVEREDVRDRITPVQYLQYGAFNSFGPVYDSSKSNIDKAQSDLLLSTYASEGGLQYAKSLQEFVKNSGDYATTMVDDLLNLLTNGEHATTNASPLQQEEQKQTLDTSYVMEDANDSDACVNVSNESRELDEALDKTSRLLLSLERSQLHRLNNDPTYNNNKPHLDELGIAQELTTELTQLIKSVKPEDLVGVDDLRTAINVTPDLLHVTLPLKVTPQQDDVKQNVAQQNVGLLMGQQNVGQLMAQQINGQQLLSMSVAANSTSQQFSGLNAVPQQIATNQPLQQQAHLLQHSQQIIQQPFQPGQQLPQQLNLHQLFQQQPQRLVVQQPNNNIRSNNALIQALQQHQIQQLQQHQQTQQQQINLNQLVKIQSDSPQPQQQIQQFQQQQVQQQLQQQNIQQQPQQQIQQQLIQQQFQQQPQQQIQQQLIQQQLQQQPQQQIQHQLIQQHLQQQPPNQNIFMTQPMFLNQQQASTDINQQQTTTSTTTS